MSHWCLAQYNIFMHLHSVLWTYALSFTLSSCPSHACPFLCPILINIHPTLIKILKRYKLKSFHCLVLWNT
jgi:hypothetical protein